MKYCLLAVITCSFNSFCQNYTSYFTGNAADITTQPAGGVCLMGGASEDDNAMTWFLEQANGGDILVIRASGSDGYNDYFYTGLGVTVNSVESIVWNDATASDENYIHQKIEQAEAIWMAGGDQWNYVSYWRNTAIDSLINKAISERNIVIGGTSAGMAVLGEAYFTAQNGTVTSATALNDPMDVNVTVDNAAFLNVPYMNNIVTDSHYDNPDRRGRHVVFMAKAMNELGINIPRGIACEEYVAVCIDTFGIARVYGGYPTYDEQAYFIRMQCDSTTDTPGAPVYSAGVPLEWGPAYALTVYKVNATSTGANYFDLNTWEDGAGGEWQGWWVDNGVLNTEVISKPVCVAGINEQEHEPVVLYPNPVISSFQLNTGAANQADHVEIIDITGRIVMRLNTVYPGEAILVNQLIAGCYVVTGICGDQEFRVPLVIR